MIASCQIVGASALTVFLLGELHRQAAFWQAFVITMPLLIVSIIGFVSGIWLWNSEKRGFRWSILIQSLQIPVVSSPMVVYKIVLGFGMTAYLTNFPPKIGYDLGGQGFLVLARATAPFQVGINFFAILALLFLLCRHDRFRNWLASREQIRTDSGFR